MSRSRTYAEPWLEFDGLQVVVDDVLYTLHVSCYEAIYPYPESRVSVMAEPVNKHTVYYQTAKRYLGDDWSIDVLESDNEYLWLQAARTAYTDVHGTCEPLPHTGS